MKLKPTDDSLTEYKDWKLKSIIIYIYMTDRTVQSENKKNNTKCFPPPYFPQRVVKKTSGKLSL